MTLLDFAVKDLFIFTDEKEAPTALIDFYRQSFANQFWNILEVAWQNGYSYDDFMDALRHSFEKHVGGTSDGSAK